MPGGRPVLVLAPMQAVTDLPFMRVMERFGGPDVYVTEYFRVYPNSRLDPYILRSVTENPSGTAAMRITSLRPRLCIPRTESIRLA